MNHGLATPLSSQEERLGTETALSRPSVPVHTVQWLDSDTSEDEDFLPQKQHQQMPSPIRTYEILLQQYNDPLDRKRGRNNSFDGRQLHRRRIDDDATPEENVRHAIDLVVDTGSDRVDLSHLGLVDIPDDIEQLRYVTVVRKDVIKSASLQLYLYANELQRLNPRIFLLKNLSVLSLRGNKLTEIPPEVVLLENLVELSLGNNLLTFLPSELLRLPKLTTLSMCPNPYLLATPSGRQRQIASPVPTLFEISTRLVLQQRLPFTHSPTIPCGIEERLDTVSNANCCVQCRSIFYTPNVQDIIWLGVFGNPNIPIMHRFCSIVCANGFQPQLNH